MKADKESKLTFNMVSFVALIIFLVCWVAYMTRESVCDKYIGLGEIGDTIGGLTAPIIGILSGILVYLAFSEQKKANDEQSKTNTNNRWFEFRQRQLDEIFNSLQKVKLSIPIGSKNQFYNYDEVIEFSGTNAILVLQSKLNVYTTLDRFQSKAIDIFVFEYGFCLEQLRITIDSIYAEKIGSIYDKRFLFDKINFIVYSHILMNTNRILETLHEGNDPKNIREKITETRDKILIQINPDNRQIENYNI